MSQIAQDNLPALKFNFFNEIIGTLRKISEICRKAIKKTF